ncbi:endonuclease/exonuclease/phosphatase family protein [Urechidicola croceus]|uniref:Endonuclease n=1 Tax=Urechidicola croceus TaxID=1850246 RepID=A0A1D8P8S5_9FLAO|nr:endonuclease [Urechidicola croceus]AOW20986.1 endonuclease [Urechidicola croceus]
MFSYFKSQGKDKNAFTVAFYNLENLFDTKDDPHTFDDDFTPGGRQKWFANRYFKKIKKLSSVISQIGTDKSFYPPAIIGVAEIENKTVLEDLIYSKNLKAFDYDFVHYNSPDMRGIDVGFLYNKSLFKPTSSMVFPLYLEGEDGERDYTRDVLWVKGCLNGEHIHILVNHWPSRRKGTEESEYKRMLASELNQEIVNVIRSNEEDPKIIIMGDFNDNPTNNSIKSLVKNDFYNPMERLLATGNGTLKHDEDWYLFDQIIFSNNFLGEKENTHSFKYAKVFDNQFLKVYRGKNKGKPFRTFIGKWYQGGFSDHFPVHVYLKKN